MILNATLSYKFLGGNKKYKPRDSNLNYVDHCASLLSREKNNETKGKKVQNILKIHQVKRLHFIFCGFGDYRGRLQQKSKSSVKESFSVAWNICVISEHKAFKSEI